MMSTGNDVFIRDVLTVMPAGMLTILIFSCVRIVFSASGIQDLHEELGAIIASPFMDMHDHLGLGMAYSALVQVLWVFWGARAKSPLCH